jgi:hypothetical protein
MYWLPYTGPLPAALAWPGTATITTSLAVAALIGAGRVLLLVFTAARQDRSVSVPFNPVPLDEVQEVKQAAA